MDEKIYEQEITEEFLTASGDTSEPDVPEEEASTVLWDGWISPRRHRM